MHEWRILVCEGGSKLESEILVVFRFLIFLGFLWDVWLGVWFIWEELKFLVSRWYWNLNYGKYSTLDLLAFSFSMFILRSEFFFFGLNSFHSGLCGVTYFYMCMKFYSVNPFRLIGVGLLVWTLAVAGCGASFNFWFITICRM